MTTQTPLQQGIKATWQAILALGVASIILGAIIAAWPGPTTLVVGVLFGVFLLVSGGFQLISGLFGDAQHRVLTVITGALSIILGVAAFRDDILTSVAILGIWIGIGWIFSGVTSLTIGITDKLLPGRTWVIVGGVLSLLGGIVLISNPFTVKVLVLVSGIWAIAIGVMQVLAALQLRSAAKNLEQQTTTITY